MRTPINNNGCRSVIDPNVDFHAGHFLCDVLHEVGHDVAWLAQHMGRDVVFLEDLLELPNMDAGGPVHNGEMAMDETCFKEVARFRVCPREGTYGIQVPKMAWHTLDVHEPSTIFESKDGAYGK